MKTPVETTVIKGILYPILNLRNKLRFIKYNYTNSSFRETLQKNKELENLHRDQRCFIVGSGPSLKNQNLNPLKDEIVISVNDLMKSDIFNSIKPKYHIYADPWNFSEIYLPIIKPLIINAQKENAGIKFFFPLNYNDTSFYSKNFPNINFYCFYSGINFTLYKQNKINYTKMIYSGRNVIHHAIYLALYLGFNEIYLLGVDMTGFLEHYEKHEILESSQYGHVYDKDKGLINAYEKISNSYDNEFYLKAYGKMFETFKDIKKIAKDIYNVDIINLTKGSALDVFERKLLDTV